MITIQLLKRRPRKEQTATKIGPFDSWITNTIPGYYISISLQNQSDKPMYLRIKDSTRKIKML